MASYLHMRRLLSRPFAAPSWPAGTLVSNWDDQHAPIVHALLRSSYAQGGGTVAAYAPWRRAFVQDNEFDATACLLAFRGQELAGVALCWSTGFVKDLCVAKEQRRLGLGAALLGAVFQHFSARGAQTVELKVQRDNPSGAQRLYERLGFEVVPS